MTSARYDSHMSGGGDDRSAEPVDDPRALAAAADAALTELASSPDPAAFSELLWLSSRVGECLGLSARRLAEQNSWASVAQSAGTSRQAAWERWRG